MRMSSDAHCGSSSLSRHRVLAAWMVMSLNSAVFAQNLADPPVPDMVPPGHGLKQPDATPPHHVGTAPLVVVEVSERWIAALADQRFQRKSPVNLLVMGASVKGIARTSGQYAVRCVEANGGLGFDIHVQGSSMSSTNARKGPAWIDTLSTTEFTAKKRVLLEDRTLVVGKTSVDAATRSRESRVNTRFRLGRRLVRWVADRRMRQSQAKIDAIAEREARSRITTAVDKAVDQFKERIDGYLHRFEARGPWIGWGKQQALVQLQTKHRCLCFSVRDGGGQMVNPLVVVVGGPERESRIRVNLHLLDVLTPRLRQALRRTVAAAAIASSIPRRETSRSSWSVDLLESDRGMQTEVRGPGFMVRSPLRSHLLLALLRHVKPASESLVPQRRWAAQ